MAKKRTRQFKIQARHTPVATPTAVAKPLMTESMIGYDFALIKKDLLKTVTISGILIASLLWLSFYLR